ncbi:MAG: AraC family transcriptional regulator [Pseudomonadota bacterium]
MASPLSAAQVDRLVASIDRATASNTDVPFSVYTSVHEQRLVDVPINKPLLVVVLRGSKHIGRSPVQVCSAGEFVFLSDSAAVDMRNIPGDERYHALLIEFDYADFDVLPVVAASPTTQVIGVSEAPFLDCLQQWVDSVGWGMPAITAARKRELLAVLSALGFTGLRGLMGRSELSHRLYDLLSREADEEASLAALCRLLGVSESTLRRRLHAEGTGLQAIKDAVRLGRALHLLQTTALPIGVIAGRCGYSSQSRFTARFKARFGLTPSALRKTHVTG